MLVEWILEEGKRGPKNDINALFKTLKGLSIPTFICRPLPSIDKSNNKFSSLFQLSTWLSQSCDIQHH